jgi:type IV pilus assembly protein PilO
MAGIDVKNFSKLKWYYQLAIVGGVCALVLAAVWYQFLSPMQDEIATKQKQMSDLQLQVAKSLQQQKMYEQMKADSVTLAAKLEDLKKVLPLDKETPEIINAMQSEAKLTGVNILRVGVRPVIEHEVYTEWPWDIEAIGTYNNVSAFFDKIRQLPRIVNISNVKLTSRAADGPKATSESVGATYTATTFIYHEEPIQTAAPPAKPVK